MQRFLSIVSALFAGIVVALVGTLAAGAADKTFISRAGGPSSYSAQLGVQATAVYVLVGGGRLRGLYIESKPRTDLGKLLNLSPGMVLLSVDGYSMSSTTVADQWIAKRPKITLQYKYVIMSGGKPTIQEAQKEVSQLASSSQAGSSAQGQGIGPVHHILRRAGRAESAAELESLIITLVNQSRTKEGLPALKNDAGLAGGAKKYAQYMAQWEKDYDVFGNRSVHQDLQGRLPHERAQQAGISNFLSENIGRGTREGVADSDIIRTVHAQMMAEAPGQGGHRENLMDAQAASIGVGVCCTQGRLFFVEWFGK